MGINFSSLVNSKKISNGYTTLSNIVLVSVFFKSNAIEIKIYDSAPTEVCTITKANLGINKIQNKQELRKKITQLIETDNVFKSDPSNKNKIKIDTETRKKATKIIKSKYTNITIEHDEKDKTKNDVIYLIEENSPDNAITNEDEADCGGAYNDIIKGIVKDCKTEDITFNDIINGFNKIKDKQAELTNDTKIEFYSKTYTKDKNRHFKEEKNIIQETEYNNKISDYISISYRLINNKIKKYKKNTNTTKNNKEIKNNISDKEIVLGNNGNNGNNEGNKCCCSSCR